MPGVDQQIHEHLVELRDQAVNVRQVTIFLDHLAFVFELVPDNVQGRINPLVEVGLLPFLLANMRETLQILNDLADTTQAILGFAQQAENVFFEKFEIVFGFSGAG